MIISRTPFRISFFGGGTDYPAWYLKEGGAVLSTSIDKYCYITCRYMPPFFRELRHRIVWRHVEAVYNIADILHPAIRAGLGYLGFDDSTGLEIHYQGDLPARTGMGSSSSFAVGFIKALLALRGQEIGKHELSLKAIELEQVKLGENVGCQDQVAAAYGGLNIIRFKNDGQIAVEPLQMSSDRRRQLESRLVLFYTGTTRSASSIAADVIANLPNNTERMKRMLALVGQAQAILVDDRTDLDNFGRLLHETWQLKRGQSNLISNSEIDLSYSAAISAGALGGKLLGAGSSGFMMFYVPEDRQLAVIAALGHYLHVPFQFDHEGCTLMSFTPNA